MPLNQTRKTRPLVVLGLDTGDYESICRWVDQGHLPTIGSIMQRGCYGTTGGPEMICEYGVSLSMFSGVSRKRHGYYYHRQLRPGTYELHQIKPGEVDWPVFWSRLGQGDGQRRVLAVDVPDVNPMPGLSGIQVADWGTHHGSENQPTAEPPEALRTVQQAFGPRLVIHFNPAAPPDEIRKARTQLFERVERKGKLARALLDQGPFDLIAYFFSESDAASHYFWKYRPEASNRDAVAKAPDLQHSLREIYQAIDREMGTMLAMLPDDTNVVILSLYGIQDEYPTSTLTESFCKQLGYHVGSSSGGQNGNAKLSGGTRTFDPVSIARKLMPQSWRAAISKRLPRAAQERLLSSMLRDNTDWSRTRAFAIPSISTGYIRINLKGREPKGTVEAGTEYNEVLSRIENDLRQLKDPKNGEPAIRRSVRTVDLFGGDPPRMLPDLFVEWEPRDYFVDRVEHPRTTLTQEPPEHFFNSQEKLEGFFAVAGPDIHARGDIGQVSGLDLAPTFLHLLGEPVPQEMDGTVIERLFRTESGR